MAEFVWEFLIGIRLDFVASVVCINVSGFKQLVALGDTRMPKLCTGWFFLGLFGTTPSA
jgi:hypothetical protein